MIHNYDDGPPDPPLNDARQIEHERHIFRSDPRNALRKKVFDGFGRWVYEDTGTTYNLSEEQYAKLEAEHEHKD